MLADDVIRQVGNAQYLNEEDAGLMPTDMIWNRSGVWYACVFFRVGAAFQTTKDELALSLQYLFNQKTTIQQKLYLLYKM